jgi:hypothetical protein
MVNNNLKTMDWPVRPSFLVRAQTSFASVKAGMNLVFTAVFLSSSISRQAEVVALLHFLDVRQLPRRI